MPDKLSGGKGDDRPDSDFDAKWLAAGIKVEREHTEDPAVAKEIAKDHLTEDPLYYKKLRKIEKSMDEEIAMLKAAELTGPQGGHYHLTRGGVKVYSGKSKPREHAQVVQNIKTATKAAMHSMRTGKIGHYEKARQFLSRYDNHGDAQVRRVLSAAHNVLHRSAQAMVGKSKTVKAAHIYSMIRDHHKQKSAQQPEKPSKPKGSLKDFYQKKAEYHKAKMQEHSDGWDKAKAEGREALKRNGNHWKYFEQRSEHEKQYLRHKKKYESAQAKSALGQAIFGVSMTKAKQQLHLEKRRNKKGVVVGKWVGAKKPTKKPKPVKKPKASKPKRPEKTAKPKSAIIKHTLSDGRHLSKKTSVPYTHVVEMLHNGSVKVESWHKSAAGAEKSAAKNRIAARKRIAKLESAISSGVIPKGDFQSIESMKHVLENEKNYLSSSNVRPVAYQKPVDQMTDTEKAELKMPKITFSPRINKSYKGFEYTIEQTGDKPPLYYPTSVKIHTGVRLYGTPEEVEQVMSKIIDKHVKKSSKPTKTSTKTKKSSTNKKKPAFYDNDMNTLMRELDFVRDPVKSKKYSDLIDWPKVEEAVKGGTDAQVAAALKHVKGVLRSK